jgi:Arc/MetJ-type ribon-helix-helix transcriptional regulator
MTIHLPDDLANSIQAELLKGHFVSEDELVAAAVRDYLRRQHGQARSTGNAASAGQPTPGQEEPGTQELQRRLFQAGVLSEIKPPITDLAPYRQRQAIPIQGEPLSETVLRERR